jgi:hypothetical protein|nr:MAG TPA: leucine-rich repeat protein [Caudoviricetes sp.]
MTIINTVTTAPDIKMGAREVKPTSFPTEVLPPEGYNALSKATIVAPDNLEPENIKKGVDIAGVVGTLDAVAGASKLPQVVDKTVTEITAEDLKGCTKIGGYAFYATYKLKSVVLPDTITNIGDNAFFYSYLESISLPDTLTEIRSSAFSYCSKLTSVTIPTGLTKLFPYCFQYCTALTSITIPENISEIGARCFYGTEATNITVLPSTPPTAGIEIFGYPPTDIIITVPKGSLEAYKTATNWSQYADKMVEASE